MEAQLTEVLKFFDLGKQTSHRRAGGYANENYFVSTDKGRFVVKILREHAAASVDSEIDYLTRVAEHQFPAVTYISGYSGECVYESGDFVAVAMHKIEGESPTPSYIANATMGSALAQLHAIPTVGLNARPSFLSEEFMTDAVAELSKKVPANDLKPYLETLSQLDEFRHSLEDKTRRIIHCDFTPNNCLFRKDELVAVLDWEEATLGYPLLDIANAILSTCFAEETLDKKLLSALVSTYFDNNDWGELVVNDLEQSLRFAGLTFSLWVYLRWGIDSQEPFIVDSRQLYWRYDLDNIDLGL